ncbi:hypothetical protein OSTOST_05662, partial [Ostertagia ostertagi]
THSRTRNLLDGSALEYGQRNLEHLKLYGNHEEDRDEADNDSHFSYGADFDDEDVIKCSRSLLNEKMHGAQKLTRMLQAVLRDKLKNHKKVEEHETHSLQAEMVQEDDGEVGKEADGSEVNGDDIEEKIEVKHSLAQEGAKVEIRPPTAEIENDNSGTITENAERGEVKEGEPEMENETSDQPENELGSNQQSPEPPVPADDAGEIQKLSSESAGEDLPKSASPTEETDQKVDEGEMKSREGTLPLQALQYRRKLIGN